MPRIIRQPIGIFAGLPHGMARRMPRRDKPIVNQLDPTIALNVTVGRGAGLMVDGRTLGLVAIGSRGTEMPVRAA